MILYSLVKINKQCFTSFLLSSFNLITFQTISLNLLTAQNSKGIIFFCWEKQGKSKRYQFQWFWSKLEIKRISTKGQNNWHTNADRSILVFFSFWNQIHFHSRFCWVAMPCHVPQSLPNPPSANSKPQAF